MSKIGFLQGTLNLLFPPVCGFCGVLDESFLCSECYKKIYDSSLFCKKIYDQNCLAEKFFLYEYEGIVRSKIIEFKFGDKSFLANSFAEMILKNKVAVDFIKSYDVIVPVPVDKKRMAKRGYNQSELVAKRVGRALNVNVNNKILKKVKIVEPQSELSSSKRKVNVVGAFGFNGNQDINGKAVLVFDDVYTTGSTVFECLKELKKGLPKKVGIFSIAKTV